MRETRLRQTGRKHVRTQPIQPSSATPLCNELQNKIKVELVRDADLIHGNICFLTFAGGYSTQLKRPTRQVISSGWARTAGAQRSLRLCSRRRWQRAQSPSCPSGSPSKVQRKALCIHQISPYNKTMCIFHWNILYMSHRDVSVQKKKHCFVMLNHLFDHQRTKN